MTTMININFKQLLDEVFCDISNNEGRGKCYLALADNTCGDHDYSGYYKN